MTTPDFFRALCAVHRLPLPDAEYRFHPTRRWRFDYAFPAQKVALEVEGGVWTRGRHTRGAGFLKDAEKYNAAAVLGWRIIRVTPRQLCDLNTIKLLREAMPTRALQAIGTQAMGQDEGRASPHRFGSTQ